MMFALLALACFVLATFGVRFEVVNLVALGLAFVAAHLLVGLWPLNAIRVGRKE